MDVRLATRYHIFARTKQRIRAMNAD